MLPSCVDEHTGKYKPRQIFLYVLYCNGLILIWKLSTVLTYFGHILSVCIFSYTEFSFGYGHQKTCMRSYTNCMCVLLDKTSAERTELGLVFSRVTITNYTSESLVSTTGIGL